MKDWTVAIKVPDEVYQKWKKFRDEKAPKGYNNKPMGSQFTSKLMTEAMIMILQNWGYWYEKR